MMFFGPIFLATRCFLDQMSSFGFPMVGDGGLWWIQSHSEPLPNGCGLRIRSAPAAPAASLLGRTGLATWHAIVVGRPL